MLFKQFAIFVYFLHMLYVIFTFFFFLGCHLVPYCVSISIILFLFFHPLIFFLLFSWFLYKFISGWYSKCLVGSCIQRKDESRVKDQSGKIKNTTVRQMLYRLFNIQWRSALFFSNVVTGTEVSRRPVWEFVAPFIAGSATCGDHSLSWYIQYFDDKT